jgi:hypothetical protein
MPVTSNTSGTRWALRKSWCAMEHGPPCRKPSEAQSPDSRGRRSGKCRFQASTSGPAGRRWDRGGDWPIRRAHRLGGTASFRPPSNHIFGAFRHAEVEVLPERHHYRIFPLFARPPREGRRPYTRRPSHSRLQFHSRHHSCSAGTRTRSTPTTKGRPGGFARQESQPREGKGGAGPNRLIAIPSSVGPLAGLQRHATAQGRSFPDNSSLRRGHEASGRRQAAGPRAHRQTNHGSTSHCGSSRGALTFPATTGSSASRSLPAVVRPATCGSTLPPHVSSPRRNRRCCSSIADAR